MRKTTTYVKEPPIPTPPPPLFFPLLSCSDCAPFSPFWVFLFQVMLFRLGQMLFTLVMLIFRTFQNTPGSVNMCVICVEWTSWTAVRDGKNIDCLIKWYLIKTPLVAYTFFEGFLAVFFLNPPYFSISLCENILLSTCYCRFPVYCYFCSVRGHRIPVSYPVQFHSAKSTKKIINKI